MAESFNTWIKRFGFNLFPCYRRTGARVTYIAEDQREVRIKLPLNWTTRGYFGTTFGGSLYGAVDPVFMVMLNRLLGRDFVVWDKAARIRFKRPGRGTLYARFTLDETELADIRAELSKQAKVDRTYYVDLTDEKGVVHASVEKLVSIRRRGSGRES
jgi:acyl-coenzyme A thioesterase PaaI-like protein